MTSKDKKKLSASQVSPAIQDYLKACYQLTRVSEGPVSVAQLAETLEVAPPSVTNMVKKMAALKLVKRLRGGKIELAQKGEQIALEVIRHHRLLETFLVNALGMDWADAHKEAEILEHYISERLETLMDKYLSSPKLDPHGEPIPSRSGAIPNKLPPHLSEFPKKSKLKIDQIKSRNPEMLTFLQERGFAPGAKLEIKEIAPFEGPISIQIKKDIYHISRQVAECVYCLPLKQS